MATTRLLLVLATSLASGAAGYSLLRANPPTPPAEGFACIAVPAARLIAPGQRATLHLYDTSSLQVLRHAQSHCNGTYGQVVIDEDAMLERKFKVLDVGSRLKVLSSRPATHTDKFGGTSNSVYAEVIGIGILQPTEILQREPFLTVQCGDEDSLLLASPDAAPAIAEYKASLAESAALCESLAEVAKPPPGTPPSQTFVRGSGGWTLAECVGKVLEARELLRCGGLGCATDEPESEASIVRLSALACTAHLPGEDRLKAMKLAQQGQLSAVLEYVQAALKEEGQRRLAKKALSNVLGGDDASSDDSGARGPD